MVLKAFLFMWVLLAPIRPAMASVFLLPMVDMALGLLAAYRAKRPITSTGIKRTVAKVFLYEVAVCLAFTVETYMTGPFIPVIRMVTGLIGITELKSCLEHLDDLGANPLFKTLVSKLAPEQPSDTPPTPPQP